MRKTIASIILWGLLCCLLPGIVLAQARTVTGTVTTQDGTGLQGVTVAVKGTARATSTLADGKFSILAESGQILEFSSIGYETKSYTLGNENSIKIVLNEGRGTQENEVIVTAYGGRQNKREISYQAQQINGDEIAETQRDNWLNALAGRVAGVNITPTGGAPGSSTSIILRGPVSLGGNNQPLFVVDGIPYDNQTVNQENLIGNAAGANRNSDYINHAADINPNDIETITILKGPEASALYGSDGASGAIVITTKKGKAGRAVINYDNSFRIENVYRFPQIQKVYARGNNGISDPTATINPFALGVQYAYFGDKYPEGTKLYDNVRAFFQNGFAQRHNINFEGGNEVATYRFSGSYLDQKGVVPTTGFTSISTKLTGTLKISPKLRMTSSVAYLNTVTDKASKGAGGYLLNLLNFPSDIDVRDYQNPDGSRKLYRSTSTSLSAEYDNPFWDVNKNKAQDKTNRVTLNATLDYNPTNWLTFSNKFGMDAYTQTGFMVFNPQSRFGFSTNGNISQYEQVTRNLANVTTGAAKWVWGKINNQFIAGFSVEDNQTRTETQKGERFYEPNFYSMNNVDPLTKAAATVVNNVRTIRGFGNYIIDFKKILYLSFAGSREGTSKLMSRAIDKDPFYNYGSASASFVFSDLIPKEKLEWLSFGKLRFSYGTTGKGPWAPYVIDSRFISQVTTGGGFAYDVTGNSFFLLPEFTRNMEYGGEFRFLKDRLSLDITRYTLNSRDQIIRPRYSYGSGFVLKYMNGGTIENRGVEAILTYKAVSNKNFSWNTIVNFQHNKGEVKKMAAGLPTYYDSDTWVFGNLRSQAFVGQSPWNLAGYTTAKNANGDVIISSSSGLPLSNGDFVVAGDRQPDFIVGFVNTLNYKNFSLNFNLEFRKGGDVFNGNEMFLYLTGLSTKTLDREKAVVINGVLNDGLQYSTTPTKNYIAVTPFNRSDFYNSTTAPETNFIESVNWMRLRDATLAYTLPAKFVSRTNAIKSASVFVTGTEIFMITNYSGADPSVNANNASNLGAGGAGIDYGVLSLPRGINFGLRVTF